MSSFEPFLRVERQMKYFSKQVQHGRFSGAGVRHFRFRGVESLEPRLVLSFTEIPVGELFLGSTDVTPAWADFNNDGWVDAFSRGELYRNDNGTSFHHVATLSDAGQGEAYWGDFNNDGWLDLHWNSYGCCPTFLFNEGGTGSFSQTRLDHHGNTASLGSALGDFNSDGWLDVYMGGFEAWPNGDFPDRMVLNVPDATKPGGRGFQWVDDISFLRARGVAAADFNEDGHTDVYVSNYRLQGNLLWINDGSGSNFPFTFGSDSHGARGGDGHSIGSAFGDLDSDGHIDIFAGNFSHGGQPESRILLNQGPAGNYHFSDLGQRGIYRKESWSSPALGDFDNDGMLDVFFTALQYYGNDSELFRNTGSPGNPQFAEVSAAEGIPGGLDLFNVSWADWDNDGDLDLATNGRLFRNDLSNNNKWLKVDLQALGIDGIDAYGFGATVRINVGSKTVTRHVESGQGQGNQNDLTLHFGLGNITGPVDVEVSWPGGRTRTIQTEVNRSIEIHYGSTPNRDFFSVDEDSVLTVDAASSLMNNDFVVPGGPPLSAVLVDAPANGQVVVNADGSFQYTPTENFFGEDVFTYRLAGDPNATGKGRVTITVLPTPDSPVAVDDVIVVKENGSYFTGKSEETVIPFGAVWSYLDTGVDQGTAWLENEFDDSAWSTGPGQLGFGEGDEATEISFGSDLENKHPTTYFRHKFQVADAVRANELVLNLIRDDGAALYLNGIEIGRDNLDPGADFTTYAIVGAEDENLPIRMNVVDLTSGLIIEGTNVLAVEIHQATGTSSDLSFDLELVVKRGVGAGVLDNDFEPDGDEMIAELLTPPEHGTVNMTADGEYVYTPNPGHTGTDSFTYRVSDMTASEPKTFLNFGSTWRYLDNGSNQRTAWRESVFDDTAWSSGPAQLGYGDGDEATIVGFGPNTSDKYITTYFRSDVELTSLGPSDLTATLLRDDAAAVYFNGQEVFRDSNLASDAGYNDHATSAIVNEQIPVTFSIPASVAINGKNVLAVEVHQATASSSDVSFDFELQGVLNVPNASDEGVVNITIEEINDFPVLVDDQYVAVISQPLVVNASAGVLANDTDDEDDLLTAVMVAPPTHGQLELASDGSFTYTPDTDYEGQDTFTYQASDDGDVSATPTLIAQGSVWRYQDDGADHGTDWRQAGYDDSEWPVGETQIGYGDDDEQTVIGYGGDANNKHPTTYFRSEFDVAILERLESLTAWLLRDDGAAVYVNGNEVYRDTGVPENPGYDVYVAGVGENATTTFSIPTSMVVQGTNVIAVEVHQTTPTSSDLSFDFELTAAKDSTGFQVATVTIDIGHTLLGDVNLDGNVDVADIDDLFAAIGAGSNDSQYDLDQNGSVESADVDYLITTIFQTTLGDTDLDGDVDTGDLTRAIIGFTGAGGLGRGWASGDTDGDGDVDTGDLTSAIIAFTGAK